MDHLKLYNPKSFKKVEEKQIVLCALTQRVMGLPLLMRVIKICREE
jgi:hypothetical protein